METLLYFRHVIALNVAVELRGENRSPTKSRPSDGSEGVIRKLTEFQEAPEPHYGSISELTFEPNLDRFERRFIHTQATKLGLISKSMGVGIHRHCVVTKRQPISIVSAVNCLDTDPIQLTTEQKASIRSFIAAYPIYDDDIDEHVSVADEASAIQDTSIYGQRTLPQIPPPGDSSPETARLRAELPATHNRDAVIRAIESNEVTLITGGTGCGKTTQVPQFILDRSLETQQPVRIICTQPRRLPAIAVADRVARERGEKIGATVGYHVGLEQRTSAQTVLTYCTSGVLLRMLAADEIARDCTHIILDEIHEREQNTDYLLIALKQALQKRTDLKVILMSATMEGNLRMFMEYFRASNIAAHVDIPSRLFSVDKFFLPDVLAMIGYSPQRRSRPATSISHRPPVFCDETIGALKGSPIDRCAITNMYLTCGADSVDIDLALATVKYIMDSPIDGAILVFLPGYEDIQALRDKLNLERWPTMRPAICLLHSQLNTNDQKRVFEPSKQGERKVILSTNIAEASLTIDDVVFVVNCGKAKEKTYDHFSRISQLKVVWIAKSNAEQRSGRAGRCRPGFCFRLYSEDDYARMLMTQVAEMQRSAIHDVCLHSKIIAPEMSVKGFLELAPEPPARDAIDNSLQFLEQLGALYSDCGRREKLPEPELTQLGRLIAQLPMDPQLTRLLLFGYALRCFAPVVTLVALLSHRDPFTLAVGDEKTAANIARDTFAHRDFSDHLMMIRAFNAFTKVSNEKQVLWCRERYLSLNSMKAVHGIRRQLLLELHRIQFINDVDGALDDGFLNEWPMIQAAIVAGCHPCIGEVKDSKIRRIRTSNNAVAKLHPSSSLRRQTQPWQRRGQDMQKYYPYDDGYPIVEYLAFQELVTSDEGPKITTATAIPAATIVVFAGPIRLSKDRLGQFGIGADESCMEEEYGAQEDADDFYRTKDILELETWLSVRGSIGDLMHLMQLRFKVMNYFLRVLRSPSHINDRESKDLLSTLYCVLEEEHAIHGYNEGDLDGSRGSDDVRRDERTPKEREEPRSAQYDEGRGGSARDDERRGGGGGGGERGGGEKAGREGKDAGRHGDSRDRDRGSSATTPTIFEDSDQLRKCPFCEKEKYLKLCGTSGGKELKRDFYLCHDES